MRLLLATLLFPVLVQAQQVTDSVHIYTQTGQLIKFTQNRWYTPYTTGDSLFGRSNEHKTRVLIHPLDLPINTATQTALDGKASTSHTHSGVYQPVGSYLTAADITGKANIASPAFTGTPTGIGLPIYAQVTGSNATTTGQALVDITGLSVALTTNATYEFEAVLSCQTSAVTTGTAYGINYSAAGATVEAQITGAATLTATKTLRINALNSATALFLAGSAQTGGIIIKGRVTTAGNAGNLTVQHTKITSGTSTIFIGSFLKVTRIN